MFKLLIGIDFSDDPSGRYYTDGDGSGEEFREEILRPLLSRDEQILIDIDTNVQGYGSSFLVEAFGGLIKYGYFTSEFVLKKIQLEYILTDFEFYEKKINQYIVEARYNSEVYISTKEQAIKEGVYKGSIDKSFLNLNN